MKRLFKILGWVLLSLVTVCVIGIFCLYWWLSTRWTEYYTETEMKAIAKQINTTPQLPDNFYIAFDQVNPGQRDMTVKQFTFFVVKIFLFENVKSARNNYPCNSIVTAMNFNNKMPTKYMDLSPYMLAFGIEKYASEKKCFDYNIGKLDLDSKSKKYLGKSFKDLTVEENVILLRLIKNPNLINKLTLLYEKNH